MTGGDIDQAKFLQFAAFRDRGRGTGCGISQLTFFQPSYY